MADRLIQIWPQIISIINFWNSLPRSKQPSSKSYLNVKKSCADPLYPAKLKFFSFFASMLEPYLHLYQTDKPMLPYMCDDLTKLITNVLSLIVKESVISSCKTGLDLKKIDLDSVENLLKTKEINVGFAAAEVLNELKKKDIVTNQEIKDFKKEVYKFVKATLKKIFERSPIGSVVVRNSNIFNPIVMANTTEVLRSQFKVLLTHFIKLKIMPASDGDKSMSQFSDFIGHELKLNDDKFRNFDRNKVRLDDFFFNIIGVQKYDKFAFIIKVILTVSHGQAAIERGFSLNKTILDVNMKKESIVARKIIRDHMLTNSIQPHTIDINNAMIVSFKAARQKYQLYLEEIASKEKEKETNNRKAIIISEINEVQLKHDEIAKTCIMLDEEFIASVRDAEEKNDMLLEVKANAMKRRCEEKKVEIKELEKALAILQEKRKKL